MKKRITLLVASAILILCIGVVVAAVLQTKEENVPKDVTGQNSSSAENEESNAKPSLDTLLAEGENGRLVLAEVNLPEIPLDTVDISTVQKLLNLALAIYEKNDTVVLKEREIITNRKCAQGVLTEIDIYDYRRYEREVYDIFKELAKQAFPTEIHVDTDDVFDPVWVNTNFLDGDKFFFDMVPAQCGWENATEWYRDWFMEETEINYFSLSRNLDFLDSCGFVDYRDTNGELTSIFPTDGMHAKSAALQKVEEEKWKAEQAKFEQEMEEKYNRKANANND